LRISETTLDRHSFLPPVTRISELSGSGSDTGQRLAPGSAPNREDELSIIRRKRCQVLVVDDEDLSRNSLAFKLRAVYGVTVHEASTGVVALELVGQRRLDLILVDVWMPGQLNGLETCKAIRARGIDYPIVLMSAYRTSESIAEAHSLGLMMLEKPLDEQELRRLLLACGVGDGQ
jgi:CheY-like chemotaxis protein